MNERPPRPRPWVACVAVLLLLLPDNVESICDVNACNADSKFMDGTNGSPAAGYYCGGYPNQKMWGSPGGCRTSRCYCGQDCLYFGDCCSDFMNCYFPHPKSISPSSHGTSGGEITIEGDYFGLSATVTVGGVNCPVSSLAFVVSTAKDRQRIKCTVPAGTGKNLPVMVTGSYTDASNNIISTQTKTPVYFSFSGPVATSLSPSSISTDGTDTLTLLGSNFGPTAANGKVFIAGVQLADNRITAWSQTSISFKANAGVGYNIAMHVEVNGQTSSIQTFSYKAPTLSDINPKLGPPSGGLEITLTGTNFDSVSKDNNKVTVENVPAVVVSATYSKLVFTLPSGAGSFQSVRVTVAGQSSTSQMFSYFGPSVDSISSSSYSTSGGSELVITGNYFSTTQGDVTAYGPCSVTSWTDTQIKCTLSPGEGMNLPVVVTVGQLSDSSKTFSYSAPIISLVNPLTANTQGGTPITVTGTSFGLTSTVTIGSEQCAITSRTHSKIICTAPEGQGIDNTVSVSVLSRTASTASKFAYNAPSIDSINPKEATSNSGGVLTIFGSNFGTSGTVTVGGAACQSGAGFKHTTIECVLPNGGSASVDITVTVGGQVDTLTGQFSYSSPVIATVQPTQIPTGGNVAITLQGTSFTASEPTVTLVRNGQSSNCPIIAFSHTQVTCTAPSGTIQYPTLVKLTTSVGRTSNADKSFAYAPVYAIDVTPNTAGTEGGTTLTISGSSFDTGGDVTIGGKACSATSWGHSVILCFVAEGSGQQLDLSVTVRGVISTLTKVFSYVSPALTGLVPSIANAAGGQVLVITGTNFGPAAALVTVDIDGVNCPVTTHDHKTVRCTIPAGTGIAHLVSVTTTGQKSINSLNFAYQGPIISSVAPNSGPTKGDDPIVITGSNFGPGNDVIVTVDGAECTGVSVVSDSKITCNTPSGQGTNKAVQVVVDSQSSNLKSYSYQGPDITNVSPNLLPTSGGVQITVTGNNFGTNPSVTVGGSVCTSSSVNAQGTEIRCTAPGGYGSNIYVLALVEGTTSNSYAIQYQPPAITGVTTVGAFVTQGGVPITVTGTNFGDRGEVYVSGSKCTPLILQQDTKIICHLPPGQGALNSLVVVVSGQESPAGNLPYAAPTISSIAPTQSETNAASIMTILGTNFGTSGTVFLGTELCQQAGAGFQHTKITCTIPDGEGVDKDVDVTIDGQSVSKPGAFSYSAPVLTQVFPASIPTGGGVAITLEGKSFGLTGTVDVSSGGTCAVSAYSHTRVVCTMSAGSATRTLRVLNSGRYSNSVLLNYDNPAIVTVEPTSVSTDGTDKITIIGSSFDAAGGTVTVGTGSCSVVSWDHNKVICTVPAGQGSNLAVTLTTSSNKFFSQPGLVSYKAPILTAVAAYFVTGPGGSTGGGEEVTITGTNFGVQNGDSTVSIGGTQCQIVSWSHTTVVIQSPKGEGKANIVQLLAGGQTSTNTLVFKYGAPSIQSIAPNGGDASGGNELTLNGLNFGVDPKVFLAENQCTVTQKTHTKVVCTVPPGQGNSNVFVIAGNQYSGSQVVYKYSGPTITDITSAGGKSTAGNVPITLLGTSFGTSGVVAVSGSVCPTTEHTNTKIVCTLPPGEGAKNEVKLTVGNVQSNAYIFAYDPPTITSINPESAPTSGAVYLTVAGTNFGVSGSVTVGGKPCPSSSVSNNEIICEIPVGDGVGNIVTVSVAGQVTPPAQSKNFKYDGPSITSLSPGSGNTKGQMFLTINGESFSVDKALVKIGATPCPVLAGKHSHKKIVCTLPAGVGSGKGVIVEVDGRESSASNFNYNPPSIDGFTPVTGGTQGGTVLTFLGTNFGADGNVTVDGKLCAPVDAGYFHDRIECSLPTGTGANKQVVVQAGNQQDTKVFSYHGPSVTSVTPDNGGVNGGETVTLAGDNFGEDPSKIQVTFETTPPTTCTNPQPNHTHVTCQSPAGTGDVVIKVTVDAQLGSNTVLFTYNKPLVTSVSGCPINQAPKTSECPILGSIPITLNGHNFAADSSVTVGGLVCAGVKFVSTSKLICSLPANPNGGFDLPVVVTASGKAGDPAKVLSYSGPEIFDIPALSRNGNVVTFEGKNLFGTSTTVFYGPKDYDASKSLESFFQCTGVDLTSVAGGQRLTCNIDPNAAGTNLAFQVKVDLQISQRSTATIAYPVPTILPNTIKSLSGAAGSSLVGTSSEGEYVYFDANNVGNRADLLKVYFGPAGNAKKYECGTVTITGTTVGCITPPEPGSDGPYVFLLTAVNQDSSAGSDTYKYPVSPIVEGVEGCPTADGAATTNCPTAGNVLLTISGKNFATSSQSISVLVGTKSCPIQTMISTEKLTCMLPNGVGELRSVVVTVGNLFSRAKQLISYAPPAITGITGCTDDASGTFDCQRRNTGSQKVTIIGTNFGVANALVVIGGKDCGSVEHDNTTPHEKVTCIYPSNTGVLLTTLVIQGGGLVGSGAKKVGYVQCPAGQYIVNTLDCAQCDRGSYTNVAGQPECDQCESGYYQDGSGATTCKKCSAGSSSSRVANMGPITCTQCDAGSIAEYAGLATCTKCPLGRIAANSGLDVCTNCPKGRSTTGQTTGQVACAACAVGTFSPSVGEYACRPCPAGKYADNQQSEECTSCDVGSFQPNNGGSICELCPKGAVASNIGSVSCTLCDSGSFANATGLEKCFQCDPGSISVNEGLGVGPSSCSLCPIGEYIDVSGQATCLMCVAGYFGPSTGLIECTACEKGTSAPSLKSGSCVECNAGFFAEDVGTVNCAACAEGKFAASAKSFSCELCAAGKYQGLTGRSQCIPCAKGSAAAIEGQPACKSCADGFAGNQTGMSECTPCGPGTYSAKDASNLLGPEECEPCEAGRAVGTAVAAACVMCSAGEYQEDVGKSSCKRCEKGKASSSTGAQGCVNCIAGSFAGTLGQLSCEPCPIGFITEAPAAESCSACLKGSVASSSGLTICSDCNPGYFAPLDAASLCEICPIGKYSAGDKSFTCVECEQGRYNDVAGSSSCKVCALGKVQVSTGQVQCMPCGVGEFSRLSEWVDPTYADVYIIDNTGWSKNGISSSIEQVTQTQFTLVGQTPTMAIVSGSKIFLQPSGGASFEIVRNNAPVSPAISCVQCPAGSFTDLASSASCSLCPTGRFASSPGEFECAAAPAGSHVPSTGAIHFDLCDEGFYQDSEGSSICLPCPAGYFSNAKGAVACSKCPLGSYASSTNSSSCIPCAPAYYADEEGRVSCRACPAGRATNSIGSILCPQCKAGAVASGLANSVCSGCAPGKYQNAAGKDSCIPCPAGSAVGAAGQSQCVPCVSGTFTTAGGATQCDACGKGTYSVRVANNPTGPTACDNCNAGSYQNSEGQGLCIQCEVGQFTNVSASTICNSCKSGRFSASSGASVCDICTTGKSSGPAAVKCESCEPGKFAEAAESAECAPCPAGSDQEFGSADSCKPCELGYFAESTGLPKCKICKAGRYSNITGSIVCQECIAGRAQKEEGQSSCAACEAGKFAASNGELVCVTCGLGEYTKTNGQSSCLKCEPGKFAGPGLQTTCQDCTAGNFASKDAAFECLPCEPGKYVETSAAIKCENCAVGTAQGLYGMTTCINCTTGRFAGLEGSFECLDCPLGRVASSSGTGLCKACSEGHFQNNVGRTVCKPCSTGTFASGIATITCDVCPSGKYTSEEGTVTCTLCETGTAQDQAGKDRCEECTPGRANSALGQAYCKVCPAGYFSEDYNLTQCSPCPAGEFSKYVAQGAQSCFKCPAGKFQGNEGQDYCVDCLAGTVSDKEGSTVCDRCDVGRYSDLPGATACKDCDKGRYAVGLETIVCTVCQAGTFGNTTGLAECYECLPGTAQKEAGKESCLPCDPGRFAFSEAQAECEECASGRFTDVPATKECEQCLEGRHQKMSGQVGCTDCQTGRFSEIKGEPECPLCPAGRYQDENGTSICKECQERKYQDTSGQTSCKFCQEGRFNAATRQVQCLGCLLGRFGNETGLLECPKCPAGLFSDEIGLTQCKPCTNGTYSDNKGDGIKCPLCNEGTYNDKLQQSNCTKCDVGEYQDEQGQTKCKKCPAGKFNANDGQSRCKLCPAGFFQDKEGQIECKRCAEGTHQNFEGMPICEDCQPGTFANGAGAAFCKACDAGKFTNETKQNQCKDCAAGKSANNRGAKLCDPCNPGFFANGEGSEYCEPCGPGYGSNYSAIVCEQCVEGKYQDEYGQPACKDCPQGRKSVAKGVEMCEQCSAGTYTNLTGQTECSNCLKGRYSAVPGLAVCTACEVGKFGKEEGLKKCDQCTVGFHADVEGLEQCKACKPGSFADQAESVNCTLCPIGHEQRLAGESSCDPCPLGTSSDGEGTIMCARCTAGKYDNNQNCVACPPGTASNDTGNSQCPPCAGGTFQDLEGQLRCKACGVGEFQEQEGKTACEQCLVGRYTATTQTVQCTKCQAGSYINITGQVSCQPCPSGRSASVLGSSICSDCAEGRYSGTQGSPLCKQCAVGTVGPKTGLTSCDKCPPGKFGGSEGGNTCEWCPMGRFMAGQGAQDCTLCDQGFFQNETGTTACKECQPGKNAGILGKVQCDDCAPGYFSQTAGAKQCEGCPPGRFGNETGLIVCEECRAGYYQPHGLSPECRPCPKGSFSGGGAEECELCSGRAIANDTASIQCLPCKGLSSPSPDMSRCMCDAGYYSQWGEDAYDLCRKCPVGSDCKLAGVQEETIAAKPGYWRSWDQFASLTGGRSNCTLEFVLCADMRDCLGGPICEKQCAAYREGPLCAIPVKGAYRTATGAVEMCPENQNTSNAAFVFVIVACCLALIFQYWLVLRQAGELIHEEQRRQELGVMGVEDFEMISAGKKQLPHTPPPPPPNVVYKLKIALGFAQIMTNLAFAVDIPWPRGYRAFVNAFSFINFDFIKISAAECVFTTDYFDKLLVTSLLPIGLFFLLFSLYLVPKYLGISHKGKKETDKHSNKRNRRRFWRMILFSMFLIYPMVSSTVLRLYVCKEINHVQYLMQDYRITCWQGKHLDFAYWSAALVLIYPIGIPAFIWFMLYRYRNRLKEPGVEAELGFLYAGYTHDLWWFEMIDMAHKLFQVSILAFLPTPEAQLRGGMCVAMGYMCVILLFRPYIRKGDDRLHLLAQAELISLLFAALVFGLDPEIDDLMDLLLSILLVGVMIAFGAYMIPQFVMVGCKSFVKTFDTAGEKMERIPAFGRKVRKWRVENGQRAKEQDPEDSDDLNPMTDEGEMAKAEEMVAGWKRRKDGDGVLMQRNPMAKTDIRKLEGDAAIVDSAGVSFTSNPLKGGEIEMEMTQTNPLTTTGVASRESSADFAKSISGGL